MKKAVAAAVLVVLAGASGAQAGMNLNVNVDVPVVPAPVAAPLPVYQPAPEMVAEAPQFIYSPPLGFYVSVGLPYDVVYIDNGYYVYRGGYWYNAPTYRGPWTAVSTRWLPTPLHRYRYNQIRYYRDREYRVYMRDRDHYRGRWYRPVPVTERRYDRRDEPRYDRRDEYRERRGWDRR